MSNNQKAVFFKAVRELPPTEEADRLNSIINIFKGVEEYVLDTTGVIVSSNLEAVTITGYEEWEVIGRHFSIFYSTEDQIKRTFEDDLSKAIRQGYCYSSGLKMKKRNSPFWAKIKLEALTGEDSEISGFRLTIQDATHKALYSHNLSLVKDEYLNLFNNPFIGIFKFRMTDFKILLANEKAESILSKNWKEQSVNSFFVDQSKFDQLIEQLIDIKKVENFEFEMLNPEGGKAWVSLSGKYFYSVGFVEGVIMDVTDRKREMEKTLSLSNELEAFIYHTSHDLRSPITSMYGLVNLLKKETIMDKISEYSRLIEGRLFHLDNLMKDIVEIAYNTAVPPEPETIVFENEIPVIIQAQSKIYPNVNALVEFSKNKHLSFKTDLARLRSILRNVISNAFKYNNATLSDRQVKINVYVSEQEASVIVEDNGMGIPADQQDRIFSLFYKANSIHKGNGLGLYIVKSMVTKLGGEIKLVSTLGKGTIVKIIIPNSLSVHLV
jgi:PAS domain S-box-containing protein